MRLGSLLEILRAPAAERAKAAGYLRVVLGTHVDVVATGFVIAVCAGSPGSCRTRIAARAGGVVLFIPHAR